MIVHSADDVDVTVHDLGGSGTTTVLFSHATGFHGRCYAPMARHLHAAAHSWALDYRGHGDARTPPGWHLETWRSFGDDAVAVATLLAADGPIVGFGHSMGGAGLLMAAHRAPELFKRLVLFEPIVYPSEGIVPHDHGPNPLVAGARRRRPNFRTPGDAYANYASKPPLSSFTPEALHAYVDHGFVAGEDGRVHLKCSPEAEARTFEASLTHDTWELLPEIMIPVQVVTGRVEEATASMISARVAERLPNGTYLELPDLDHFGPMVAPDRIAALVADAIAATG